MIAIMMGFTTYFLVHVHGKNLISTGDFALILGLSMELGHMMWYTMSRVDEINQAIGKFKQSLSSLVIYPEINDRSDAQELLVPKDKLFLKKLNFTIRT
ncbi:MAG: hypothetical protein ACEY3M_22325 [Wolbachia sp.]